MAFVKGLETAAEFADGIGETEKAASYRSTSHSIQLALPAHWNGVHLMESVSLRPIDGSVIHSVLSFGNSVYNASSPETVSTIQFLNSIFCELYPINYLNNQQGLPGVLYGRYPGDTYKGGNPWQLLTAALAETFYSVATDLGEALNRREDPLTLLNSHMDWLTFFDLSFDAAKVHDETTTTNSLILALLSAGDSVMTRLWAYLQQSSPPGLVTEQMDKFSGNQVSARDLTWSYANILHALYVRDTLSSRILPAVL